MNDPRRYLTVIFGALCLSKSGPCGSCGVHAFRGALFPSKSGLMNLMPLGALYPSKSGLVNKHHIVKHIVNKHIIKHK